MYLGIFLYICYILTHLGLTHPIYPSECAVTNTADFPVSGLKAPSDTESWLFACGTEGGKKYQEFRVILGAVIFSRAVEARYRKMWEEVSLNSNFVANISKYTKIYTNIYKIYQNVCKLHIQIYTRIIQNTRHAPYRAPPFFQCLA